MGAKPKSGHLFTEDDWNEVSSATVLPYYYSKVSTLLLVIGPTTTPHSEGLAARSDPPVPS